MTDQSHLDRKYFIDPDVYNCPFCNRNNVVYENYDYFEFDWANDKKCYGILVKCRSCEKVSMHLSFDDITTNHVTTVGSRMHSKFIDSIDIDSKIFYSVPTSFFILDNRIPKILRELITEAEECLKMNLVTIP